MHFVLIFVYDTLLVFYHTEIAAWSNLCINCMIISFVNGRKEGMKE